MPRFIQSRKKLQKITFRRVLAFILDPIFTVYEDFRERRKIEKLRRIAIEKKAREAEIKEERRLRYEAKKQQHLIKTAQNFQKEQKSQKKK